MGLLDLPSSVLLWLFLLTVLVVFAAIVASLAYWCPKNVLNLEV